MIFIAVMVSTPARLRLVAAQCLRSCNRRPVIPALRQATAKAVRGFFHSFPLYRNTRGVSTKPAAGQIAHCDSPMLSSKLLEQEVGLRKSLASVCRWTELLFTKEGRIPDILDTFSAGGLALLVSLGLRRVLAGAERGCCRRGKGREV